MALFSIIEFIIISTVMYGNATIFSEKKYKIKISLFLCFGFYLEFCLLKYFIVHYVMINFSASQLTAYSVKCSPRLLAVFVH